MKPLESLNNVEKAKLLHSLFPAEAAGILQFVSGMSQTIAGEQEHQRGVGIKMSFSASTFGCHFQNKPKRP
jgi:hypothetical protein